MLNYTIITTSKSTHKNRTKSIIDEHGGTTPKVQPIKSYNMVSRKENKKLATCPQLSLIKMLLHIQLQPKRREVIVYLQADLRFSKIKISEPFPCERPQNVITLSKIGSQRQYNHFNTKYTLMKIGQLLNQMGIMFLQKWNTIGAMEQSRAPTYNNSKFTAQKQVMTT